MPPSLPVHLYGQSWFSPMPIEKIGRHCVVGIKNSKGGRIVLAGIALQKGLFFNKAFSWVHEFLTSPEFLTLGDRFPSYHCPSIQLFQVLHGYWIFVYDKPGEPLIFCIPLWEALEQRYIAKNPVQLPV